MTDWEERLDLKQRTFKFFWQGLKNVWDLLLDRKKILIFTTVLLLINNILGIFFPYFMKLVFDELPAVVEAGAVTTGLIVFLVMMFGVKILSLALWHFVQQIKFSRNIIDLENTWPIMAEKKLLDLSLCFHEKENTGKKISKIDKGCDKLVDVCCKLYWNFFPPVFYFFISAVFIFAIDWRFGVFFSVPYILVIIFGARVHEKFVKDWEQWEKLKEKSSGIMCQSIINVKTVQNFVQEQSEIGKLSRVRSYMCSIDKKINKKLETFFFWMNVVLNLFFVATIVFAVFLLINSQSSVGTVIFLFATGNAMVHQAYNIIYSYSELLKRFVTVKRMKELFDLRVDIANCANPIIPKEFAGAVKFENAAFTYPGKEKPVLENFSLSINSSEMVALVGKSGEGKTTAVRLLARMYDVGAGSVSLNGNNIKDLDLYWYRHHFAFVQQDVDIFDATLRENITYSCPDASEEQVLEALKASHLEVINSDPERFPHGLETQVGERGIKLSGGECQRVGIARAYIALLNGAKVLILDEATSNLDSEAERAIQSMIASAREKLKISIVAIAHRLSTIKRADTIYVINDGHIVEKGNHFKLMQRNGIYSQLVELQKLGEIRE